MRRDDPRNIVCSCADCNRDKGTGPVPAHARAEVRRRTRRVLDYAAGKRKGEELYAWERERRARWNQKRRARHQATLDATFDPRSFG
jgi:hypothetical protein